MTNSTEKLLEGFRKFRQTEYEGSKRLMEDLVKNGQSPDTAIIACVDSRGGPSKVFDIEVGESFVARQIAALVPPYDPQRKGDPVAAYIKFTVETKKISELVVMGHTHCGGIEALIDGADGDIGSWVNTAKEIVTQKGTKKASREKKLREAEQQAVIWSLKNLMTYPSVQKAMRTGQLRLHGWIFDMEHGDIKALNPKTGKFESTFKPNESDQKRKSANSNLRAKVANSGPCCH